MRAAIYNPYLDTVGGGERYTMTVASLLSKRGWKVNVGWPDRKILPWISERLGVDLSGVDVVSDIEGGEGYDLVFWLSDGSIPTLWANKNILHFQTPFHNVGGRNFFNRLKLAKIQEIICNSKYTKSFIDNEYGVKSKVIYPPVQVEEFKPGKKENVILFVGRYSRLQQAKHQEVLVSAFKDMHSAGLRRWRLVLIGGSDVGRTDFVDTLREESKNFPIDVLENIPFSEVKKVYAKAKIFWSATGFGADEKTEPEKVEHFGISAVEAMAAQAVPLLFNAGGHREIVENEKSGILWNRQDELKSSTLDLIKNEGRRESLAKNARVAAQKFSQTRFEKEILKVIS